MLVDEFFQTTAQATTQVDLIEGFRATMLSLGFDRVHYFGYPNAMTRGPSTEVTLFTMIPPEWFEHYDAEQYEKIDPLSEHVIQSHVPFEWDKVIGTMELTRRQKRLIKEIREASLHDGVTVPIHGPFGQVNGVSYMRSSAQGVTARDLHIGRVLAVQFHQAYTALDETAGADAGSPLTKRERDVLLRLVEGLNNAVAGERLGISEHSVKFHLQNVCKKLGVNSRVAAVVKAIRLGLIVP
ncbi:autoinducer binding domain-containing protein [Emcibacter sp. SYSU 3D8]|uniref:autoinducer binding domain-containing protein n=1 Tax=Emcibacter sp. SYSU 3D8 TaxID=3133969 RepID=UPI0031FE5B6A